MMTVSTRRLVEAIKESDAFKLPEMNAGTEYLYNSVYNRLARNMDVKLSDINFDAFEPEDIDCFNDLYSNVFENNYYAANRITSALLSIAPAVKAVAYV